MTANELRKYFNETYGISKEWPIALEVDHETYANCCQAIFTNKLRNDDQEGEPYDISVRIALGPNGGIMFKNVELILKGSLIGQTTAGMIIP